jgi:hypothetical protein
VPPTSEEYARHGLPWFLWYEDKLEALSGSDKLKDLKSVETLGKEKKDVPLPENQSVSPQKIIVLRNGLKRNQVREFAD